MGLFILYFLLNGRKHYEQMGLDGFYSILRIKTNSIQGKNLKF